MLNRNEYAARLSRLRDALAAKGLDAALAVWPIDVYYFSGTRQNAVFFVPVDGEPLLLVRKSLERARRESPVADIRPFPSSKEFALQFPRSYTSIGLTFDVLPVQQLNYYSKLFPDTEFIDISQTNREIRSVKSAFELEELRYSGRRLSEVFLQVPEFLRPGMREIDVAAEFEYRLRKAQCEGYVRMRAFNQELFGGLAVASGGVQNGYFDGAVTGKGLFPSFPQGSSLDEIADNEPILLDYTGVFHGYITDMTRMFAFGDLDAELLDAFALALEIQEQVRKALTPGTVCEELFGLAVSLAEKGGFGGCFMGMPGEQVRFVGHGVGLELDEYPVLAQGVKLPLQVGNVIAVEPKFVIPGKGAIGIENTFAVTEAGGEKLTDIDDGIVFL